ncbi:MAG: ABC transporter permease [Anaerolineae bacterium]|nr:ABC transporter permease [Anaerolineae bacterium]
MDWRKVWVIARHEYLVNVRRTGFIVMTAIVPVLGILALLFAALFSGEARKLGESVEKMFDPSAGVIGVVDRSGRFSPILPEYQDRFRLYQSEAEAEQAVLDEDVTLALVIGEDYLETGTVVVVSKGSGFGSAAVSDSLSVRKFFVDHLLAGRVEPILQKRAVEPLKVQSRVLSSSGQRQSEGPWSIVFTFIVPYFMAIFLVMTIFVSSGYLLQSVAEEKESRIIEIIVSSVRPVELMTGKIAGLGALGLTQVLVWVLSVASLSGGAVALLAIAGASLIPARVLTLEVVYYVLGFILYATLMAGVGVLGTTTQESQQLAGLFSLFAALPYMVLGFIFANPNVLIARVLSFFPLTAPTMMMIRLPLAEVPWVDVAGSIAALLLSIPGALWLGARLFRVGVLIYGKRPTLKEIWLIVRRGS